MTKEGWPPHTRLSGEIGDAQRISVDDNPRRQDADIDSNQHEHDGK